MIQEGTILYLVIGGFVFLVGTLLETTRIENEAKIIASSIAWFFVVYYTTLSISNYYQYAWSWDSVLGLWGIGEMIILLCLFPPSNHFVKPKEEGSQ